jgi:hypothetical protein
MFKANRAIGDVFYATEFSPEVFPKHIHFDYLNIDAATGREISGGRFDEQEESRLYSPRHFALIKPMVEFALKRSDIFTVKLQGLTAPGFQRWLYQEVYRRTIHFDLFKPLYSYPANQEYLLSGVVGQRAHPVSFTTFQRNLNYYRNSDAEARIHWNMMRERIGRAFRRRTAPPTNPRQQDLDYQQTLIDQVVPHAAFERYGAKVFKKFNPMIPPKRLPQPAPPYRHGRQWGDDRRIYNKMGGSVKVKNNAITGPDVSGPVRRTQVALDVV